MREVELKAVLDDIDKRRSLIEHAGAKLEFDGRLIDRRYGDPSGRLVLVDHVLRLRIYETGGKREGYLDWKGPTQYDRGYKVREELSTHIGEPEALAEILENLGYSVILEIDRHIWQYSLGQATIRFERYPLMDDLVEVEGPPDAIEKGIASLDMDRTTFNADRLTDFVARFEARTNTRAALSNRPAVP